MKKISLCALAFVSLMATAQNKIDFSGRMLIERVREATETVNGAGTVAPMSVAAMIQQTYSIIVEFTDDNIDYGDVAVEEIARNGNMAIVTATAEQMQQLADLPQVSNVSLGVENKPLMYKARPMCNVDAVQTGGDGLGTKYTGKGVVTGLFDTGIDVNHINFLNPDGTPRTKAVWVFDSSGKDRAITNPNEISRFSTENRSEQHATHVLGIMAGGYSGPAKYAVLNASNRAVLTEQDAANSSIPFYGVATDADIAVGCGTLLDGNIMAGVQRIVEYAEAHKQPCVVNLSLGTNLGPHDGSDGVAKYLSKLGQRAIICISAGNEGDENLSIKADGEKIKTFVTPITSSGGGIIQFWGSDDTPFSIRFFGYDRSKGKEVFSYTLDRNLAGKTVKQSDMAGFSSAFSGSITLSSNVNTANNRYNVSANMTVKGSTTSIIAGFAIEPLANQTVEGFAYQMLFSSQSQPGFTNGSPDNSINNMACGENVIVVGSFCSAPRWAYFNNGKAAVNTYANPNSVGAISSFSSYGTTFSGHQLPDVCAPGEGIISSFSQYYVEENPKAVEGWQTGEYAEPEGLTTRNSPWGLMQGTSMSCPFVAGVIASWLEANPYMTVSDVMDVIEKTAITDFDTEDAPERFGAGKIDALAGIKEVLSNSGISDIVADSSDIIVTSADGNNYEIFVAGAKHITARLYSLSGVCAAATMSDGDTARLNAADATAGVYVLKIDTEKHSETRKIVVK